MKGIKHDVFFSNSKLYSRSFIASTRCSNSEKDGTKGRDSICDDPAFFGVQQIIEGMLWLSFRFDAPLLNVIMTYVFTLFSHVLWPIFVPFSIGVMEIATWRKKVISAFQITGIAVGLYHLYVIVKFPVTSGVNGHIVYVSPYFNKVPVLVLYLAATCVGAFFSSHKIINIFGALALLLFMVAYWFNTVAFFSVWCFFAAILSVVIYQHFKFGNERAPDLMHHRA